MEIFRGNKNVGGPKYFDGWEIFFVIERVRGEWKIMGVTVKGEGRGLVRVGRIGMEKNFLGGHYF